MALNFGILQPVNIGGQIMAGREEAQRNKLAQQQLQTGAMQQEKAQMEMADFKAKQAGLDKFLEMSQANGKTGTPEELASSFYDFALTQRDPQLILAAQTMRQAATERSAYLNSKLPPKISPVAPAAGTMGSGTYGMDQNVPMFNQPSAQPITLAAPVKPMATPMVNQLAPPPAAAAAPVNQLGTDTRALENRIIDLRTNYPNVPQAQKEADRLEKQLEESRKLYTVGGNLVTGAGKPVFTADEKAAPPPAMVAEYTFAKTPDGGNFKGSYQQFVTARAAAGRAPAQPPQPQPPVAVVDPVTGKQVYVTREQALSGKMTPASAMEGLPPKEIQAREAKYPAATSSVKSFESSAEKLAADLEKLSTHPGLSGISGLIYGRTPAVTKDARAAQALYDSIVARGGFQELQNMRASSPTGGALGNVSNQEGQYLRDAFAPINRTQDTADLSRALREAAGATRSSKQRVREAYDMTYDYKNQGGNKPAADPLGIR